MLRKLIKSSVLVVLFFTAPAFAHHKNRAIAAETESPSTVASSGLAFEVDHIDNNTVYFKKSATAPSNAQVPNPLKLASIYDLKPIGALRPAAGDQPYFLFQGKACKDCNQDPGIYAVRPPSTGDGTSANPTGYVMPGKILDPRNHSVLSESRAFYGRCLRNRADDVLVIFQREKIDRHGMQSSVMIAEPPAKDHANHLEETLLERHLPRINDTIQQMKHNACHEIDGHNRLMASHILDVRSLHNRDLDKDDDEDDDADSSDSAEATQ